RFILGSGPATGCRLFLRRRQRERAAPARNILAGGGLRRGGRARRRKPEPAYRRDRSPSWPQRPRQDDIAARHFGAVAENGRPDTVRGRGDRRETPRRDRRA